MVLVAKINNNKSSHDLLLGWLQWFLNNENNDDESDGLFVCLLFYVLWSYDPMIYGHIRTELVWRPFPVLEDLEIRISWVRTLVESNQ